MIVQEKFGKLIHTYSDSNKYIISNADNNKYVEAWDPAKYSREYTESDEEIIRDTAPEQETKQEAVTNQKQQTNTAETATDATDTAETVEDDELEQTVTTAPDSGQYSEE